MKKGLLIFLFTSFAFAQGASPDTLSAKLQQMERTWAAAVAQHDPLAIAPMLADAFVDTSEDGKVTDRPTYLDNLKKSQAKIDSLILDDMRVQQYGDAAVVTGRYTAKGPEHTRPSAGRFTDTFIRIGSEWKCVASQSTAVK